MTDTVTVDVSALFNALTTAEEQQLVASINRKLEVVGIVLIPVGNLGMAEKPKRRKKRRKAKKGVGRGKWKRTKKAKKAKGPGRGRWGKRKAKKVKKAKGPGRGRWGKRTAVVVEKPVRKIRRGKRKARVAKVVTPLPKGRQAPGDVAPGTER